MASTTLTRELVDELSDSSILLVVIPLITTSRASIAKLIKVFDNFQTISESIIEYILLLFIFRYFLPQQSLSLS